MTAAGTTPVPTSSVGVVIVNYRTPEQTARAIESVLTSDYPTDLRPVVVVDNASGDGSVEALSTRFGDRIELVASSRNLGFGGGNNLAAERLATDYLLLLNSDATLDRADTLRELVATAERDRDDDAPVAAWAPLIRFSQRGLTVGLDVPPRFADLDRRADRRLLGLAVFGAHLVDDESTALDVRYDGGFHPPEQVEGREFRWTGPAGVLRITLPPGVRRGTLALRVLGCPEGPTPVDVVIGDHRRSFEVPALDGTLATVRHAHRLEVPFGPDDLHDVLNTTGTFLVTGYHGFDRGFGTVDTGNFDRADRVLGFCGAAALLRRDVFARLGGFDERFFLYYEDTDLSWRLQHAGYEVRYVPNAAVRHELSVSTGGQTSETFRFHVTRNRLLMIAKNARPLAMLLAFGGFLLTLLRQAPTLVTAEGRGTVRLLLRILVSLVGELPSALRARRAIRRTSEVTG